VVLVRLGRKWKSITTRYSIENKPEDAPFDGTNGETYGN
jgi:hypothetical protein